MSFGPDQEKKAPAKAEAPSAPTGGFGTTVIKGLGQMGWLDDAARFAINGLAGWGMNPNPQAQGKAAVPPPAAAQSDPQSAQAYVLAGATAQASGATGNLSPALQAAAEGRSVADQARQLNGPVNVSAAQALDIAGKIGDPISAERQAFRDSNEGSGGYQSPFVSIALTGIRSNQDDAHKISTAITGDTDPHGYAAYGSNDNKYDSADELGAGNGLNSNGTKSPGPYPGSGLVDGVNDVAAVTQYAAAAELGIKLTPNANGNGNQVSIDWGALENMQIQADLGVLGGKIAYDNPAQVADNGYKAVMAEIEQRDGGKPGDKEQFIALTGHSGGGQSSFYTALKLASEGYKNVSLVGVDMAMTPHQREVLESLGVQVTNITSNDKGLGGQPWTSEVGEVIRTGMGGGQNYYDLNVERKPNPQLDTAVSRHDIINDPNVMTTVRFAQYLDSIGKHGQYMDPKLYDQFLADTNGKGNDTIKGEADPNLIGKLTDQRGLPGPEANSPNPGQANSIIEGGIKLLGGDIIANTIHGAGTAVDNTIDKAGDSAQGWLGGMFGKAGSFLGGLANSGLDLLGKGANAVGGFIGNGLDKAGDLAQGAATGLGNAVNWLGGAANKGLDWLGGGVSSVGGTIDNGLDKAGDSAKSWLGNIPLVGGFLGNAADKGLDLLGDGVGAVSNFVGGGLDKAGDAAQGAGGWFSGAMNWLGGAANKGLDFLGKGASAVGGFLGNGLDKAGDSAQSGIQTAANATGGWLGGLVNKGVDWVGHGVGGMIHNVGDWAGATVNGLVHTLQGVGIDASQISGLENHDSTNPSVTRNWKGLLGQDPSKIQTLPANGKPNAQSAPQPTASVLPSSSVLMDPIYQDPSRHYEALQYAD